MVVGGAVHAGVAAVWLEFPRWVCVNYAIRIARERCDLCGEMPFTRIPDLFLVALSDLADYGGRRRIFAGVTHLLRLSLERLYRHISQLPETGSSILWNACCLTAGNNFYRRRNCFITAPWPSSRRFRNLPQLLGDAPMSNEDSILGLRFDFVDVPHQHLDGGSLTHDLPDLIIGLCLCKLVFHRHERRDGFRYGGDLFLQRCRDVGHFSGCSRF